MAAAGAERRAMRRDRPGRPKQSALACGPGFSGSSHPRSAAGHALPLTEDRPRSRVSGVDRAYLGYTGLHLWRPSGLTDARLKSTVQCRTECHQERLALAILSIRLTHPR